MHGQKVLLRATDRVAMEGPPASKHLSIRPGTRKPCLPRYIMYVVALRVRGAGCASSATEDDAPSEQPAVTTTSAVQDIDLEDGFEEVLRELRLLDEGIVAVLQRGDIRLLRTAWLLAQPNSKPLPNRQELEALEEQLAGDEVSPLLQPDEAVALIHCADRRVGVLSHGWLTAGHCDPCAARLAVVVQALAQTPHLQAIFWDFTSMYQKPRNDAQNAAFGRAIEVMGDLYASAVGTTVLQHKEIPPRPMEYDGLVRLGGLTRRGCDEAAICSALRAFGSLLSCQIDVVGRGALIHLASQGAAHCHAASYRDPARCCCTRHCPARCLAKRVHSSRSHLACLLRPIPPHAYHRGRRDRGCRRPRRARA